jgi:hypothetical protein
MCKMQWNVGTNQEHELITTKCILESHSLPLMPSTCTSKKIQVRMLLKKIQELETKTHLYFRGFYYHTHQDLDHNNTIRNNA